jgi:Fe2+ transport system protein B
MLLVATTPACRNTDWLCDNFRIINCMVQNVRNVQTNNKQKLFPVNNNVSHSKCLILRKVLQRVFAPMTTWRWSLSLFIIFSYQLFCNQLPNKPTELQTSMPLCSRLRRAQTVTPAVVYMTTVELWPCITAFKNISLSHRNIHVFLHPADVNFILHYWIALSALFKVCVSL